MTPVAMANKRREGIERVTLTLPDEMLLKIEADAAKRGIDRLALMREALTDYLASKSPKARREAKQRRGG